MSKLYRERYLKLRSVLYDRNTSLPAFPLLFDTLRTALDERRALGVLHVELANLELVESLYGWQVFDRIVARAAALLRDAVGKEIPADSLLALSGVAGDRFVVFVPPSAADDAVDPLRLARAGHALARRLDLLFEAEEFIGLGPKICARVGHAALSDNPFYRFERCVYAAVEAARESPERRERRRELSWSEELGSIIRSATVDTLFQPIVEVDGGRILGHEAFVRGPSQTIFESPRAMFALSQRVGVAEELDRLCCEQALAAFGREIGEGKLFVNALASSFAGEKWSPAALAVALGTAGLEPGALVLEFSERGADADLEPFCACLARLRSAGFGIAIDDVGTGRGGSAMIERASPDFLKLDASLVRGIHDNLIRQELLVTLVRLAARVGAEVIAEGVETAADAAAVAAGGARYAQGFLYAHPAPGRGRRRDAPSPSRPVLEPRAGREEPG